MRIFSGTSHIGFVFVSDQRPEASNQRLNKELWRFGLLTIGFVWSENMFNHEVHEEHKGILEFLGFEL